MESSIFDKVIKQLSEKKVVSLPSSVSKSYWPFYRNDEWQTLSQTWDGLINDRFMNDGGTYRLRRYSQFTLNTRQNNLLLMPHIPYSQPSYINALNGGIARYYEPLEKAQIESPFLQGYLRWLGNIFSKVSGNYNWLINMHPYRIKATKNSSGKPTPEGLHRDGVDFITTLMIQRYNVCGGVSVVTDLTGKDIVSWELKEPCDLLIADDTAVMHKVSEIFPLDSKSPSHRDVLVVAFEHKN